ncbi:hypothetical protein [Pseudonocardia endophytica]|uniref:hypothetical protein n=1 Tax=Pseudonocardia endophytica TaxID=401976 RepID=UPI001404415B|nr:hypothetical protein [Pseudonocardia endophytica]
MTVNKVIKDAIGGAFEQGLGYEMPTFMSDDMVEELTAARQEGPGRSRRRPAAAPPRRITVCLLTSEKLRRTL